MAAKAKSRAANLGKFLHPKKGGKAVPAVTGGAPISVGAFDVGERKKKSIGKIS